MTLAPEQFKELTGLLEAAIQKAVEPIKTDLAKMKGLFGRFDTLLGKMSELARLMQAQEATGKEQGAKIVELKDSIKKEISDMNAQIKALPLSRQTQKKADDGLAILRTFGEINV